MNIFQTLTLSLVEGITEFLPISSTGHLILTTDILNIPSTEFIKSFLIIIQLGAILSVALLYWKKLLNKKIWKSIIIAFIPSMVVGFLFYSFIKNVLFESSFITVIMLFLGGVAFIGVELWNKRKIEDKINIKIEDLPIKTSFIIGLFQSLSVVPGTSRAGSTILGALILGVNRKTAAEFSFILAIPTMIGATALDVFETKLSFTQNELSLLAIGFISSFVIALITVKLFIKYLEKHTFIPFGIYRIIVALIFYFFFIK